MNNLKTFVFLGLFAHCLYTNGYYQRENISEQKYIQKNSSNLNLSSKYTETVWNYTYEKNIVKDYHMISSDRIDQSKLLQKAIDDISRRGGGRLIIPKGIYRFINISMKSNVHILVEGGTILKPFIKNKKRNKIGELNVGNIFNFGSELDENGKYKLCNNSSIRGIKGERYKVDYSELPIGDKTKIRFALIRRSKNFKIADATIIDNYTKFCGIIFVPTAKDEIDGCPTNGEIVNCSIYNANSGYGLCQFHASKSLYLKNIYAKGGVTLRLEPDISSPNQGNYDLEAENIKNENGRAGVLMQPHTIKNGTVKINGVQTKSSSFGVLVKKGFIDNQNAKNPNAKIGYYGNNSIIANIYSEYGTHAQVDDKEVWIMKPDSSKYSLFRNNSYKNNSSFIGPSIAPVYDETKGTYKVTYINISSKGFDNHSDTPLYFEDIKEREKEKWEIINRLPNVDRKNIRKSKNIKYKANRHTQNRK